MTNKIKAFSYLRFSTDRQRQGSSFARQEAAIKRWLKNNKNYELQKKAFKGEGESGYKAHHLKTEGSLKLLLNAVESGEIPKGSAIIVEQFNRLSREELQKQEDTLFKIWDHGITFITVSDNSVYPPEARNDDVLRVKIINEMKLSHRESEIKAQLAQGSYTDRFEKAATIQRKISEGIELEDDEKNFELKLPSMPFWLDRNGKLNGKEVIIQEIFQLYKSGYGQLKIRQKIQEKFPDYEEAQKMNQTSVLRWVKSRKVLGEWTYEDKSVKAFEAAVDNETFNLVQDAYTRRKKKRRNPDTHWELRGLCKCYYCGSTMSVQKIPHSLPNLRCTLRQRKGADACEASPGFPYVIAKHFFENFVKRDLERALSHQIENKTDQSKIYELKYNLSQLETSLQDLENEYTETKSKTILRLLTNTEADIEKTILEINKIKNNMEYRGYLSDEIRTLETDPQKQNLLFNNLELFMTIKDKKISFEYNNDNYELDYIKYVKKDKKFYFKTNRANLELLEEKFSVQEIPNFEGDISINDFKPVEVKEEELNKTVEFITRVDAEKLAK